MIYGDNVACCHLANSGKPTERARHIDIQYFAIQEWTARKIISLDHIPGRINFSDALTDGFAVCRSMKGTRMKSIRERKEFLSDVDGGVVPDTPLKGTNIPFNPLKSTNVFRLDPRLTHALGILPRANPPVV